MITCRVDGCGRPTECRGLCDMHYKRQRRHGSPEVLLRREQGSGTLKGGYVVRRRNDVDHREHVVIAERALGHALRPGAIVHHADRDRTNNSRTNLVICPSQAYHRLLHVRMAALDASGNANWRRCHYCKTYDDPAALKERSGRHHHAACKAAYQRLHREAA